MIHAKRSRLSPTEKNDIWSRWKSGQSLHEIGRAYGKPHPSIRCVLLPRGGIAPAARRRSRLALTLAEREDISRGIASGSSLREIANRLDRASSTVSREVSRHCLSRERKADPSTTRGVTEKSRARAGGQSHFLLPQYSPVYRIGD
jgi:DNA-binding CsgD family transcriptional regulator